MRGTRSFVALERVRYSSLFLSRYSIYRLLHRAEYATKLKCKNRPDNFEPLEARVILVR